MEVPRRPRGLHGSVHRVAYRGPHATRGDHRRPCRGARAASDPGSRGRGRPPPDHHAHRAGRGHPARRGDARGPRRGRRRVRGGHRTGRRGRRARLRVPLRPADLPGAAAARGCRDRPHRPHRGAGPVRAVRRARRRRVGPARRLAGPAGPGRAGAEARAGCSTPSSAPGCSASTGWGSPPSSPTPSGWGSPRSTPRSTGPPARCRPSGCGTPPWTSRCWSSSARCWPSAWPWRARPSGPRRSSRPCAPHRCRHRGSSRGAGSRVCTPSVTRAASRWSASCG